MIVDGHHHLAAQTVELGDDRAFEVYEESACSVR